MKKLLGIVVLGLLWCNISFAGHESKKKVVSASGGHVQKYGNPPLSTIAQIANSNCQAYGSGKARNFVQLHKGGFFSHSEYSSWNYDCQGETQSSASSGSTQDLTFTIKDKKEQCEAIGFTPKTEKFADCVLRLVELDVKNQQQNQIELAVSQGNQQVADELRRQRNDRSSQFFLDLGQQLLSNDAPASLPSTSTCRIQGSGSTKYVSCW